MARRRRKSPGEGPRGLRRRYTRRGERPPSDDEIIRRAARAGALKGTPYGDMVAREQKAGRAFRGTRTSASGYGRSHGIDSRVVTAIKPKRQTKTAKLGRRK